MGSLSKQLIFLDNDLNSLLVYQVHVTETYLQRLGPKQLRACFPVKCMSFFYNRVFIKDIDPKYICCIYKLTRDHWFEQYHELVELKYDQLVGELCDQGQ